MPPLTLLIKPASSLCNMNCKYCFYNDIASRRENYSTGLMSDETIEKIILSACEYIQDGVCSVLFQGGEPTLAGLDFYKKVIMLQKKYSTTNNKFYNSIQTNGYNIDETWAKFFHENDFLVGLSLDGPSELHNQNRIDKNNGSTFNKVLNTVRLFNKYDVKYNVLCVVTGKNARSAEKIYNFYKKNNFRYLQFISCLDPLEEERGLENYHLSSDEYGNFLLKIFDLWFEDFLKGNYISIRHIDNLISSLAGYRTEACNMTGHCSIQNVIESDGSVYPCDFYCTDKWLLGNIKTDSFEKLNNCNKSKEFINESLEIPPKCKDCNFFTICRNGCKRERIYADGKYGENFYCNAYQNFYQKRSHEIMHAVNIIRRNANS